MRAHLQGAAAEVGLTLEQRDVLINSRRALGAAEFARERGKFAEMHHALFEAHWHQTGKLEEIEDLKRIGASVGLDPGELGRALEEGRYEPLIDENRRQAESVGISGIPAHIFDRRYLVVGAQPYEIFRQVLTRVERDREEGPATPE